MLNQTFDVLDQIIADVVGKMISKSFPKHSFTSTDARTYISQGNMNIMYSFLFSFILSHLWWICVYYEAKTSSGYSYAPTK